jgi:CO/xanthine dehydrogenase Mo-binding subunit
MIVEIDPATMQLRIPKYVVVHDCGTVINPVIVAGQIQGGVAQGIGNAFYERLAFDEQGQLINGTLADYLLPTSKPVAAGWVVSLPKRWAAVPHSSQTANNRMPAEAYPAGAAGEQGLSALGPFLFGQVAAYNRLDLTRPGATTAEAGPCRVAS